MKGFGYYGNGGGSSSSSSSNLSALAPPFTVDRSNSNPIRSSYGAPLMNSNSSIHSWTPSPHLPNYFTNPNPIVDNVSMPPPAVPKYPSSQYIEPTMNYMELDGGLSFGQYSDSVRTSLVDEKPSYLSYVSPAIGEGSPLVALNDSGYNWSCTSRVAPLSGSSQDEYTRSLSGLEYSNQWGGFWNGMTDLESARSEGYDKTFSTVGPYINKDYLKQGAKESKDMSMCAEYPSVVHGIDVNGRENHFGPFCVNQSDDKSSTPQIFGFIPSDSLKAPISGSPSITLGIHSQANSPKLGMKSWNCHSPPNPSNEKHINVHNFASVVKPLPGLDTRPSNVSGSPLISPRTHPESFTKSCNSQMPINGSDKNCIEQYDLTSVTKPSPGLIVRPPSISISSSSCTLSHENYVNYVGSGLAGKAGDITHTNIPDGKDPRVGRSSEGNTKSADKSTHSGHLGENDYSVIDSPSRMKEPSCNRTVNTDAYNNLLFEPRIELQAPQIRSPDRSSLAIDDSNPHNPAEDSPCWKGATSRFSPFENSEAVSSQHLLKKLDPCVNLSLHGPQTFPLNTADDLTVFCKQLGEKIEYNGNRPANSGLLYSMKWPSIASYIDNEHPSDANNKAGSGNPKPSCGNGVKSLNTIHEPKKSDAPTKSSDIDYKPSKAMQHNIRAPKQASETCIANSGMNVDDVLQDGLSGVPYDAAKQVLSSPSSGEDSLGGLTHSCGEGSTPDLNLPMLVMTMHNLSDLLLLHCSNDAFSLKKQDHSALKHVIHNLDACLQYVQQKSPPKESWFLEQGTHLPKNVPDLNEDARVDMHQDLTVNIRGDVDKSNNCVFAAEIEAREKVLSQQDDADKVTQDNMTQAIKKILSDNFHDDEETERQVLLYKNLWLEAEAEICSKNYKARFDRLKAAIEKLKVPETEEVPKNVEKLSRCKVSPDHMAPQSSIGKTTSCTDEVMARFCILKCREDNLVSTVDPEGLAKSAGHAKDLPTLDVSVQGPGCPTSSKTSYMNNVEDSVKARFHILNCRIGNSMTTVDPEEQVTKLTPDQNKVDNLAHHSNPDIPVQVQGCPLSSHTIHTDNDESSVMDRYHILKCRAENSNCWNMQGQQMPEFCDLGFVGIQNNSPVTGDNSHNGRLQTVIEQELQQPIVNCVEGNEAGVESHICIEDNMDIQSFRTDKLGRQFSGGWYDSSSSDWEQVLKDEFTWQRDSTQSII